MPQKQKKLKVFAKKLRKNLQNKKKAVPLHRNQEITGCSAVRLAHLLWEQGVPGSNPGIPTTKKTSDFLKSFFVCPAGATHPASDRG